MRISDWSSDVCSSDLRQHREAGRDQEIQQPHRDDRPNRYPRIDARVGGAPVGRRGEQAGAVFALGELMVGRGHRAPPTAGRPTKASRSEEHTSELQSLMRISYAVFCLKKKTIQS